MTAKVLGQIPEAAEVRGALDRVLSSSSFRGSRRCHDFLEFVVTKALEGGGETLKERTLAVEVFGRVASEDLGDNSIVRVGAREVRKRLAQYYVADGAGDPVRIDLTAGSYIPMFQYHAEAAAVEPLLTTLPHEKELVPRTLLLERSPGFIRTRSFRVGLAVLIASAALLSWGLFYHPKTEFDTFWKPLFDQKGAPTLLLAHPIVYHPSTRASRLDEELNGHPKLPLQRPIQVPPNMLDGSDYVPVTEQYVGFGDTVAALRLVNLMFQHGSNPRVRLASKVEFNDLVGSGAILVGAFTNRWTTELTKNFRFRFEYDNGKPCILDGATNRRWTLASKADNGRSTEDYIIISRLPHSPIGGLMIICAGLMVYGTEEGGRILSQPDLLIPILKKLPGDWKNKNIELVLHLEVVGDAPALPELVAQHSW